MAYEVLQDFYENLSDLVKHDAPELIVPSGDTAGTTRAIQAFFVFARAETRRYEARRRAYSIRFETVRTHIGPVIDAFDVYYTNGAKPLAKGQTDYAPGERRPRPVPAAVRDFLGHLRTVLKDQSVTIYQCKRPITDLGIDFDHLAGLENEKEQLRLGFIYPPLYRGMFHNVSRGILLYGPPGTGKTLLARAATRELHRAAFFTASASELKSKFVGGTEKAIRQLFRCAGEYVQRKSDRYDYAVIFLDEFDSLATSRAASDEHSANAVNQLLQEMDGLASDARITVLAATNYPQKLDIAIMRRFDTTVFIDTPDLRARESIIMNVMATVYMPPNVKPADRRITWDPSSEQWSENRETLFETLRHGGRVRMSVKPAELGEKWGRFWLPSASVLYPLEPALEGQAVWTSEFSKNDVHELARQTGPRTSFKASMSPRPLGDEDSTTTRGAITATRRPT